jgi:hypothetical protein
LRGGAGLLGLRALRTRFLATLTAVAAIVLAILVARGSRRRHDRRRRRQKRDDERSTHLNPSGTRAQDLARSMDGLCTICDVAFLN